MINSTSAMSCDLLCVRLGFLPTNHFQCDPICGTCSTHAYTGNFRAHDHELQHHETDALNMLCLLDSTLCATCWADVIITVLFRDFSANSQGTATEMNEREWTKLLVADLHANLRPAFKVDWQRTWLNIFLQPLNETCTHQHTNKLVKRDRDACSHVSFFAERVQRAALQLISSAGLATSTDRRADLFAQLFLVHTTPTISSWGKTLHKQL